MTGTTHEPLPLVHDLVALHARERPDAVAIEDGTTHLTYAQFDALAEAFALRLRSCGVAPDDIVAVDAPREASTLVAMLGVWKAGGAYLPIDPALPEARRRAILEDARPRCHITRRPGEAAGTTAILPPALDPQAPAGPAGPSSRSRASLETLAYVLYTSGSTGRPKGVLVEHKALAHRADVQQRLFDVAPGERVTQFTSLSWDASLFELMLAWGAGATLCLIPERLRRSGPGLTRFLADVRAHVAFFPPSVLATLAPAPLPELRMLMAGGDALPPALVERWGAGRRIVNLYGPTEATVWMTTEECVPGEPVTIGKPIPDVDVVVLDEHGQMAAEGEVGELGIGGAGLARGYLHRFEETRERFIEHPARPGERLYRSGDRGRFRPDGRIELHGRVDGQVKIRGMRMELGEIETALAGVPGVRLAAVVTDADARGEKRLVAYVTMEDTPDETRRLAHEPLRRALRDALLARLPEAMVPALYVEMAPLPRLANDKLDRRALPPPSRFESRQVPVVEAPRNETERLVADLWAKELGVPHVGLHENVFELGAHSLLATHVQAQLEQALGRSVDIVTLFEHPTVAALARQLAAPEQVEPPLALQGGGARGAARRAALAQRGRSARRPPTRAAQAVSEEADDDQ